MEKTPSGTSVGVDDPYAFAGRCDHVTDDGRCRFAVEHAGSDPEFARERREAGYACLLVEVEGVEAPDSSISPAELPWHECPHYRSRTDGRECVRCGLEERRTPDRERPLLDEHHLSYARPSEPKGERSGESGSATGGSPDPSHEITVSLCRWCHAKVHRSWARIDDDASPDPEAIAAREGRLTRERAESAFETASERSNRK